MKPILEMTRDEARQAWLSALRSGTRKQAKARLRVEDSFCCLGVVCDMDVEAGGSKWQTVGPIWEHCIPKSGGSRSDLSVLNSALLPPQFQRHLGLLDEDVRFLAALNDSGEYTFKQIADLLERIFKGEVGVLAHEHRMTLGSNLFKASP